MPMPKISAFISDTTEAIFHFVSKKKNYDVSHRCAKKKGKK